MEGKTRLLLYLKKEIERRQIVFTEEDGIEIDFEKRDFFIVV
jgi:hypothetical protein